MAKASFEDNMESLEKIVNELISELKNSEYSKRTALFDEIRNAINKN